MVKTELLSNGEGKYAVKRTEDVSGLIESIKQRRTAGGVGSKEMRLAAEFPATVIENYINRIGITFAEFMADSSHATRLLNDPDLKGFRIWEGRA
jgi:hypothetical protein